MIALLKALLRLLLPIFREWWRSKNWSAHSIRNLKEIHYIFFMHLVQFALFLYIVDYGLNIHIFYSDKINKAAVEISKVEQVIATNNDLVIRNDRLEEQIRTANQLIGHLANFGRLPEGVQVGRDPTASEQVEGFKDKYREK